MSVPTTERELTEWLVGDSEETRDVRRLILKVAPTHLAVWIEEETGVGKEQVAQALHAASGRRGAFVAVNVCAIAESMFEDAFFGHVCGAFTGARDQTLGYFGEADGGTLFLDEMSGLSLLAQAKLLRAVETQRYRQIGARADRQSHFRVVAASNERFDDLLGSGRFRLDLGFRLRGSVMRVPALRDRLADIGALAARFLTDGTVGSGSSLTEGGLLWLRSQTWRGNVRELRQLLHCAQMLATGEEIGVGELRSARALVPTEGTPSETAGLGLDQERAALQRLLAECGWDTLQAAGSLGVDRTTVYRRMRRFGIEVPRSNRNVRSERLAPIGRQLGAQQSKSAQ